MTFPLFGAFPKRGDFIKYAPICWLRVIRSSAINFTAGTKPFFSALSGMGLPPKWKSALCCRAQHCMLRGWSFCTRRPKKKWLSAHRFLKCLLILSLQEEPKADSGLRLESESIIHNRSYPYFFMFIILPQTAEIFSIQNVLCVHWIFQGGSIASTLPP